MKLTRTNQNTSAKCVLTILFLVGFLGVLKIEGQVLLIPSIPTNGTAKGKCKDLDPIVTSDHWRVRKKQVFEFRVVQPFVDMSDMEFSWEVVNGKILSGQGTSSVEVMPGNQKTAGYLNASGFVRAKVIARNRTEPYCTIELASTMMIGKYSESNGAPNVVSIIPDRENIDVQTDEIVNISSTATDPENDVLSYEYRSSAGKIIGAGANVKWDLSGVAEGEYSISVGVDDGMGIRGTTKTAKVIVTNPSPRN